MELKNMKQEEIEKVEIYYEWIQKMAHGLQVRTIDNFLTIVFKMGCIHTLELQLHGWNGSTFQHHKEAAMLCEEGMTTPKTRNALLVLHNTK